MDITQTIGLICLIQNGWLENELEWLDAETFRTGKSSSGSNLKKLSPRRWSEARTPTPGANARLDLCLSGQGI
jgi:hypothetical protein